MTLSKREQDRLIVQHYGFIRSRAVEFWKLHKRLELEECISEAMLAAVQDAPRFDPARVPFSMFVSDSVRWRLNKMLRTASRRPEFGDMPDLEETPALGRDIEDIIDTSRFHEKVAASPVLSRRLMGHTLYEIGTEEGVVKSTVMRREAAEIEQLRGSMAGAATSKADRVNIQKMDPEPAQCPSFLPSNSSPPPVTIAVE